MLKTIVPARLEYREGAPYSDVYGDIYHPAEGGAGQAQYVFLEGCGLPGAWADRACFVILETGFGTGLNFLATWAAWRADPERPGRLHFLSVEKHPFHVDDLAQLHARWPEFAPLAAELRANWPMLVPGFHRIALDGGRVQLTLMLGDARDCLPEVDATVDAIYLDGFAPDRNPDLWQAEAFAALARLARPGALAATYTVAASVKAGLTEAGFACEKRAGHGPKRHCLRARYVGRACRPEPVAPKRVAVVGAGVAGAAVAHALERRWVAVTVVERAPAPAQGASGNPIGVFRPLVSRDDNRASRLTRAAFLHDLRSWEALGEQVEWSRCGVLHLARDAQAASKQQQALAAQAPPASYARWVDLEEARALANWPVAAPGVFYPEAGWIVPSSLCRAWLASGVELRTGSEAGSVRPVESSWQVWDVDGRLLVEADAVVFANAHDVLRLLPGQRWPLHVVRGQITELPRGSLPEISRVIAREGYVAVGAGRTLIGATYEHDDEDTSPRQESDRANLARLETILPGASARLGGALVRGRASLRATLPDRLPLVGAVPEHPGLYVAAGYASRGVVWAGLLGEALADAMLGAPLPLEKALMGAIAPQRFA
jgi:tRNA 5-methylaminomethyl-2-thiouridine biosynthesis bifunctional protein